MSAELALHGGAPVRTEPYPTWPPVDPAVEREVLAVVRSGHWWQSGGGAAERLEAALVDLFGVRAAVAVANGTVALEVALLALGVGPGDEVLVPAMTFVSTATAVHRVGAVPVPVDVEPETLTVDVPAAAARVGPRTRALVAVHLAGCPADLDAGRALCDRHGIALVEDSAQAVGARWRGRQVGTVGDVATLSFQAAKLLPGGDGGAVLVRDGADLAARVERIANCGRPRGSAAYDHELPATNGRISEFAAAVVLAQLAGYPGLQRRREAAAERVRAAVPAGLLLRPGPAVTRPDWYMLLLRPPADLDLPNQVLARALTAEGVPAQVMYPNWATLPAFRPSPVDPCPQATEAARRVVWLHHRLLLDDRFPADLAAAWAKVSAGAGPSG